MAQPSILFLLPCFALPYSKRPWVHKSHPVSALLFWSSIKKPASRLVSEGGVAIGHPHPKWDELPLSCTLRVRTANGPHPPNNAAHQNPEMRSVIAKQWSGWLTKRGHWLVSVGGYWARGPEKENQLNQAGGRARHRPWARLCSREVTREYRPGSPFE
jgi:hypothetical protein